MKVLTVAQLAEFKGRELGLSRWFDVQQGRIDQFADAVDDHEFIHVDAERAAKETPFGGTIAHGFLTLSLLSRMVDDCLPRLEGTKMGVLYGFDRIRFLAPVRSGSRIRGRFILRELEEKHPGEISAVYDVTVEIEGEDKPALVAVWLTRRYLDAASRNG